jgi:hypothetical protein
MGSTASSLQSAATSARETSTNLDTVSFNLSETLEQYINHVSELWLALDPITDLSGAVSATETNPADEEQAINASH